MLKNGKCNLSTPSSHAHVQMAATGAAPAEGAFKTPDWIWHDIVLC